ncbi:hypothetical protein NCCP1664_27090 [Zafaria cholistanensis]|uniref:Secreted protein n=1 Tax=Zafaria cholistanensis TaxID=1682741 RepID=A0A5A7NTM7_9MICC|nr:hypothetical protein NCCP1664_27090 [Zafaria cholistanensis]
MTIHAMNLKTAMVRFAASAATTALVPPEAAMCFPSGRVPVRAGGCPRPTLYRARAALRALPRRAGAGPLLRTFLSGPVQARRWARAEA